MKKIISILGIILAMICVNATLEPSMIHAETVDDELQIEDAIKDGNGNFSLELTYEGIKQYHLNTSMNSDYKFISVGTYQYKNKDIALLNSNMDLYVFLAGTEEFKIVTENSSGTKKEHILKVKIHGLCASTDSMILTAGSSTTLKFYSDAFDFDDTKITSVTSEPSRVNVSGKKITALGSASGRADVTFSYGDMSTVVSVLVRSKLQASDYTFQGIQTRFDEDSPLNSEGTMIGKLEGPVSALRYTIEGVGESADSIERVYPYEKGNYIYLKNKLTAGVHNFQIKLSPNTQIEGTATIPFTIYVDAAKAKPDQSWLSTTSIKNDVGWYQDSVTYSLSQVAKDAGYESISIDGTNFSNTAVVSAEGTQKVDFTFKKTNGDVQRLEQYAVSIDKQKPVITQTEVKLDQKKVIVSGTDTTSGIKQYTYSMKDKITNEVILENQTITNITTIEGTTSAEIAIPDGYDQVTYTMQAVDVAGWSSDIKTLDVTIHTSGGESDDVPDLTWVTMDHSANEQGWHDQAVTFTLSETAKQKGYTKLSQDATNYSTSLNVDTEGVNQLTITFQKEDGTYCHFDTTISLDTSNPIITNAVLKENDEIELAGTDAISGISSYVYDVIDVNAGTTISNNQIITKITKQDGTYQAKLSVSDRSKRLKYVFKAKDQAGHTSDEAEVIVEAIAQPTPQTPDISWLDMDQTMNENWYTSPVTLQLSQVAKAAGYETFGVDTMQTSMILNEPGWHQIALSFEKTDGTRSANLPFDYGIDLDDPLISSISLQEDTSSFLYRISFGLLQEGKYIKIQASDETSGVAEVIYSIKDLDTNQFLKENVSVTDLKADAIKVSAYENRKVQVCAYAKDIAGRSGDFTCETIDTTIQEVGKLSEIQDDVTKIKLMSVAPIFESIDRLDSETIFASDETIKQFLAKEQKEFVRAVTLTWRRNGAEQPMKLDMTLMIPKDFYGNNLLYLEQADGSFQPWDQTDTSHIPLHALGTVLVCKEKQPDEETPKNELVDTFTGIKLHALGSYAFHEDDTLKITNLTNQMDDAQRNDLHPYCPDTHELKEILSIELLTKQRDVITDGYEIYLPANQLKEVSYLAPSDKQYEVQTVVAKDGYFKLTTKQLGIFAQLSEKQPNKSDEIVNPGIDDEFGTAGSDDQTTMTDPKPDVSKPTDSQQQVSTNSTKTSDFVPTGDTTSLMLWLILSCISFLLFGLIRNRVLYVTKRNS